MPSKRTAPSALDALLQTNQQLLAVNAQLAGIVDAQQKRIEQLEGRSPERPLVTAEASAAQPDVTAPDSLEDVANYRPEGDQEEIQLSDNRHAQAEKLLDEAFAAIAEENRAAAERMTRFREQGGASE